MKFLYTATTKAGKKMRGTLEAANREVAIRALKDRKLTVTTLAGEERAYEISIGGITALQKVVLTKHLAIMLKAGIAIDEALGILESQAHGRLRTVLADVRGNVQSGTRLSDALAAHPREFNSYYVNMIRAGEEAGTLIENLEQLSVRFGKDFDLRQKAQSAMLYPAVVLSLTIALGLVISLFVLPRLTGLFRAFDYELPWTTRALIWVSGILADYGIILAIVFLVGIVLTVWLARRPSLAPFVHRIYLVTPVVKRVSQEVNLARFSMVLGSLLKSGIPITVAVHITGSVLGNAAYREVLEEAAKRVETGEPLSSTLAESNLFPVFVTRMIGIGEQTGKLEEVLFYLAEFYESELDITLKNLSTIIEPVMLVTIGLIVAGVALSIITPIYNFIGSIQ